MSPIHLRAEALSAGQPVPVAPEVHGQEFPLVVPRAFQHLLPCRYQQAAGSVERAALPRSTSSPLSRSASSALPLPSSTSSSSSLLSVAAGSVFCGHMQRAPAACDAQQLPEYEVFEAHQDKEEMVLFSDAVDDAQPYVP